MENSTNILPPAGTTHTIKPENSKSPLWNVIKALGNKCFYFNGTQWVDSLDESYLDYYLKYYDAVTHEEIPTETPEEAEAFNKMKPYEFDQHVSGDRALTIGISAETHRHSNGLLGRCITIPNRPVFIKPEFNKPVFTQAMADTGELPPVGSEVCFEGENVPIHGYAKSGFPIFEFSNGVVDAFNNKSVYSPIDTRTPKQKAIEDMDDIWRRPSVDGLDDLFNIIYDELILKC